MFENFQQNIDKLLALFSQLRHLTLEGIINSFVALQIPAKTADVFTILIPVLLFMSAIWLARRWYYLGNRQLDDIAERYCTLLPDALQNDGLTSHIHTQETAKTITPAVRAQYRSHLARLKQGLAALSSCTTQRHAHTIYQQLKPTLDYFQLTDKGLSQNDFIQRLFKKTA